MSFTLDAVLEYLNKQNRPYSASKEISKLSFVFVELFFSILFLLLSVNLKYAG